MILNLIFAVLMAATFLYMLCRARMSEARRLVWLPAASCLVELLTLGVLAPTAHPLITLLLVALRLTMLGICTVAMRRDAAMVRARQRRRARLARELHAALNPLHEVSPARPRAEVRVA